MSTHMDVDADPDDDARRISRRRFITGVGVTAGAAVAGGYALSVWQGSSSRGAVSASTSAPSTSNSVRPGTSNSTSTSTSIGSIGGRSDRTLVVVEMAGGNDGLSTVVPYADPAYMSLRPTLGITDPLALDAAIGLAPQLSKLAERYRAGQVALIEGVGYDSPNLSHFASLATWWSGSAAGGDGTGWLGRYLDATVGFDDPLAGISIGGVPSPALVGRSSFATSIADASGLQPRLPAWADGADELIAAWSRFAPASPDAASLLGRVQHSIQLSVQARSGLDSILDDGTDDDAVGEATVAESFSLAAQLVLAEHPPRIVYVTGLGDFDTHEGLTDRHAALMTDLDAGLESFFATLDAAGAGDRAVVMTTSEFGRRAAENGSGTDHGTAAPHFIIGSSVRGGRYGEPPSLTELDDHGNLVHTVDLRSLYATVLHGWLDVDPEPILGPDAQSLDLFR